MLEHAIKYCETVYPHCEKCLIHAECTFGLREWSDAGLNEWRKKVADACEKRLTAKF